MPTIEKNLEVSKISEESLQLENPSESNNDIEVMMNNVLEFMNAQGHSLEDVELLSLNEFFDKNSQSLPKFPVDLEDNVADNLLTARGTSKIKDDSSSKKLGKLDLNESSWDRLKKTRRSELPRDRNSRELLLELTKKLSNEEKKLAIYETQKDLKSYGLSRVEVLKKSPEEKVRSIAITNCLYSCCEPIVNFFSHIKSSISTAITKSQFNRNVKSLTKQTKQLIDKTTRSSSTEGDQFIIPGPEKVKIIKALNKISKLSHKIKLKDPTLHEISTRMVATKAAQEILKNRSLADDIFADNNEKIFVLSAIFDELPNIGQIKYHEGIQIVEEVIHHLLAEEARLFSEGERECIAGSMRVNKEEAKGIFEKFFLSDKEEDLAKFIENKHISYYRIDDTSLNDLEEIKIKISNEQLTSLPINEIIKDITNTIFTDNDGPNLLNVIKNFLLQDINKKVLKSLSTYQNTEVNKSVWRTFVDHMQENQETIKVFIHKDKVHVMIIKKESDFKEIQLDKDNYPIKLEKGSCAQFDLEFSVPITSLEQQSLHGIEFDRLRLIYSLEKDREFQDLINPLYGSHFLDEDGTVSEYEFVDNDIYNLEEEHIYEEIDNYRIQQPILAKEEAIYEEIPLKSVKHLKSDKDSLDPESKQSSIYNPLPKPSRTYKHTYPADSAKETQSDQAENVNKGDVDAKVKKTGSKEQRDISRFVTEDGKIKEFDFRDRNIHKKDVDLKSDTTYQSPASVRVVSDQDSEYQSPASVRVVSDQDSEYQSPNGIRVSSNQDSEYQSPASVRVVSDQDSEYQSPNGIRVSSNQDLEYQSPASVRVVSDQDSEYQVPDNRKLLSDSEYLTQFDATRAALPIPQKRGERPLVDPYWVTDLELFPPSTPEEYRKRLSDIEEVTESSDEDFPDPTSIIKASDEEEYQAIKLLNLAEQGRNSIDNCRKNQEKLEREIKEIKLRLDLLQSTKENKEIERKKAENKLENLMQKLMETRSRQAKAGQKLKSLDKSLTKGQKEEKSALETQIKELSVQTEKTNKLHKKESERLAEKQLSVEKLKKEIREKIFSTASMVEQANKSTKKSKALNESLVRIRKSANKIYEKTKAKEEAEIDLKFAEMKLASSETEEEIKKNKKLCKKAKKKLRKSIEEESSEVKSHSYQVKKEVEFFRKVHKIDQKVNKKAEEDEKRLLQSIFSLELATLELEEANKKADESKKSKKIKNLKKAARNVEEASKKLRKDTEDATQKLKELSTKFDKETVRNNEDYLEHKKELLQKIQTKREKSAKKQLSKAKRELNRSNSLEQQSNELDKVVLKLSEEKSYRRPTKLFLRNNQQSRTRSAREDLKDLLMSNSSDDFTLECMDRCAQKYRESLSDISKDYQIDPKQILNSNLVSILPKSLLTQKIKLEDIDNFYISTSNKLEFIKLHGNRFQHLKEVYIDLLKCIHQMKYKKLTACIKEKKYCHDSIHLINEEEIVSGIVSAMNSNISDHNRRATVNKEIYCQTFLNDLPRARYEFSILNSAGQIVELPLIPETKDSLCYTENNKVFINREKLSGCKNKEECVQEIIGILSSNSTYLDKGGIAEQLRNISFIANQAIFAPQYTATINNPNSIPGIFYLQSISSSELSFTKFEITIGTDKTQVKCASHKSISRIQSNEEGFPDQDVNPDGSFNVTSITLELDKMNFKISNEDVKSLNLDYQIKFE